MGEYCDSPLDRRIFGQAWLDFLSLRYLSDSLRSLRHLVLVLPHYLEQRISDGKDKGDNNEDEE